MAKIIDFVAVGGGDGMRVVRRPRLYRAGPCPARHRGQRARIGLARWS